MAKTNAERVKKYRENLKKDKEKWAQYKMKHSEEQKIHRKKKLGIMTNAEKEELKKYERERKRNQRNKNKVLRVALFDGKLL